MLTINFDDKLLWKKDLEHVTQSQSLWTIIEQGNEKMCSTTI